MSVVAEEENVVEALGSAEKEALLSAIFRDSPDPIALWQGSTLRSANPAFLRLYGFDRVEELRGIDALALIAPSSRPVLGEYVRRRAMGEDVPPSYTVRALHRDGTEFPVLVRSTAIQLAGEAFVLTILRDARSSTQGEPPRTKGEGFYRAIFEDNPAVKLLIDPESGRVVDANRAAMEFYGWSVDELRAMRISEINVLGVEEIRAEMQNAVTGQRRYFRFPHRTKDRGIRHVEVHSGPVEIDGRTMLLSIIHDVTERDMLEARLREAEKLESIGRLAGGVAHDFNNLLTVMLGSTEILARDYPPGTAGEPHLADLKHAVQRAAALTRDLMAFGRRQLLVPTRFDLNDAVHRMTALLGRAFGPGIRIVTELAEALPPVTADAGSVERVIMNLALNARDAMEGGGTLKLRTEEVAIAGNDRFGVPSGSWVVLRVVDDGIGMDEATRARLFEPFFTTKPDGRGTGLGLATAHGVIAQSGGHITVESALGRGSCFSVFLPRASEGHSHEGSSAPRSTPIARAKLLLVDDVQPIRHVLSLGLRHAGFEVIDAGSADEAERIFLEHDGRFDALVTDIVMPERSGIELAHALRALRGDLAVLFTSGDARTNDARILPPGSRFLQKPFTSDRVAHILEEMLALGEPSPTPS